MYNFKHLQARGIRIKSCENAAIEQIVPWEFTAQIYRRAATMPIELPMSVCPSVS